MKQDNRQAQLILCLFGTIPVIWLGLLIAPAVSGGLPEIITVFPTAINNPFHIVFCEDSLKTVLIVLCAYGMGIGVYLSTRRNYRRGEEHGSAKWGNARAVDKKYRDKRPEQNKLFTQNVRMGLDGRKHRRNLNTVVVGGSGAGKSFNLAKPNLMQANTMDFEVTPHQLRHTYITNLLYAGVDPKTVQYLAGHENSKTTMDIYAKVKYNRPEELIGVVNRALT